MSNGLSLAQVFYAYIDCAEWADAPEEPHDGFSDAALVAMKKDCSEFLEYVFDQHGLDAFDDWTSEQVGHDFWLSRNGHGSGFWDRGLPMGDKLHDAAKTFGTCNLYVSDAGELEVA